MSMTVVTKLSPEVQPFCCATMCPLMVHDHRLAAEQVDDAAVLLDVRPEVRRDDEALVEHGVGAVLQFPHARHHRRLDQGRADDDLGAVHGEAADDLRIDALVADADADVSDLGPGDRIDRLHHIALALFLDPLVPHVMRVRVAEHAALVGVARGLVALVDDFALRADDESDVEITIGEIVVLHHVEFGGNVGVDLLGLAAELVGLRTRNGHREFFFLRAIAGRVRNHALDGHLRNHHQARRETFPGSDHRGRVHEAADSLRVFKGVPTPLHLKRARRKRYDSVGLNHLPSPCLFPCRSYQRPSCLRSHHSGVKRCFCGGAT